MWQSMGLDSFLYLLGNLCIPRKVSIADKCCVGESCLFVLVGKCQPALKAACGIVRK